MSTLVPRHLCVQGQLYRWRAQVHDDQHRYSAVEGMADYTLSTVQALGILEDMVQDCTGKPIQAKRKGGYECSSAGDKRFSAFNAQMNDGRTLEMWYQCGTLDGRGKGYDPGGCDWRKGKGSPPLWNKSRAQLQEEYFGFWHEWAQAHLPWMKELRWLAERAHYTLSDRFASSPINQAAALAHWLNHNP